MTETPRPCGILPQSDFESQFRRVFESAECRTQVELAAVLGIRQSSVSDAKRRKTIPSGWLMKLLEKKRTNPEWVRTGIGAKVFQPSGTETDRASAAISAIERRPAQECTMDELVTEIVLRALKALGAVSN